MTPAFKMMSATQIVARLMVIRALLRKLKLQRFLLRKRRKRG